MLDRVRRGEPIGSYGARNSVAEVGSNVAGMERKNPVPHVRASGTITITWKDVGDEEEPNFTWSLQTEPGLNRANTPLFARLLHEVAERQEAALKTDLYDH